MGEFASVAWTVWTLDQLWGQLEIIQLSVTWATSAVMWALLWWMYAKRKEIKKHVQEIDTVKSRLEELEGELADHPQETLQRLDSLPVSQTDLISGKEHLDYLERAVAEAKSSLYILSGWISSRIVTEVFVGKLEQLLERGVIIGLGYGWHSLIDPLARLKEHATEELVFHNDGRPISWSQFLHGQWEKLLKRLDLPKAKFHSLRHLYGSLLLAHGEPLALVSKLMGHANVSITLKVYAHCLESSEAGIHDRLNRIFDRPGSKMVAKPLFARGTESVDSPISPALPL